ncbi:MAG: TlpA disulfide reductase family protein [Thermoplasmata archaeon]|nr:TlpA disulfide reductase family protein [Thermoplasmata archaeon]
MEDTTPPGGGKPRRNRLLLTAAVLAVLLAVILTVVFSGLILQPGPGEPVEIRFRSLDGSQRSTMDPEYAGRIVVVDLMAATCPPCIAEMPEVLAFADAVQGQGIELISLSIWVGESVRGESERDLADFQEFWGADWAFGVPENTVELVIEYSISSPPFKLVLDGDGRLLTTLRGESTAAQLLEAVGLA